VGGSGSGGRPSTEQPAVEAEEDPRTLRALARPAAPRAASTSPTIPAGSVKHWAGFRLGHHPRGGSRLAGAPPARGHHLARTALGTLNCSGTLSISAWKGRDRGVYCVHVARGRSTSGRPGDMTLQNGHEASDYRWELARWTTGMGLPNCPRPPPPEAMPPPAWNQISYQ